MSAGTEGKVGVVTAGGSGHLPLFLGDVGSGMLSGCAGGEVFASPSAETIAEVIRACDGGVGVLCLYGNYDGDKFNFDMAQADVGMDGIMTRDVIVRDDVASSGLGEAKRRGVAGLVYAYKIAGAAAAEGRSLDEVVAVVKRARERTRSMGVALTPCVVPKVGKPTFSIAPDDMELGMGIHGEAGVETTKVMKADELAKTLVTRVTDELDLSSGGRVSVMVNGLGATPLEEQFILYRTVSWLFEKQGVEIVLPHVGEFATSMEMAGLSLTVFQLDDELERLLRAPASTPFYTTTNLG